MEEARRGVKSSWVNSGVFIFSPEVLSLIPSNTPFDLPRDVFTKLVGTNRLFGFSQSGFRCAIDSPERLSEANLALIQRWIVFP